MANLSSEFSKFHDKIVLTTGKIESLRKSRDAIRERIKKYFREELKLTPPKFHGQGSFSMKTTITPLNGEYDIDDGVYLQHLDLKDNSKWQTPETIHRWLVDATDGYTNEKPVDKKTCVRVQYAGQYHVDLPSYAVLNDQYYLAEKGEKGWRISDPKAITDWFIGEVKKQGDQLRRIVRYLKAWSDFQSSKRGKLPNGLILTVLAVRNFRPNDRDDKAFADTAAAISVDVNPFFMVFNPVDNSEEITSRLTDDQKKRFQDAINDLAKAGTDAINAKGLADASEIWIKQLGDRFPMIEEDEDKTSKEKISNAVIISSYYETQKPAKPYAYEE